MNHLLKPYPSYKDSGLPWLGEVPSHWDVQRNGRLFAQRNETGHGDLPILEVSLKTGVRVRDFESSNRKQVMSDRAKYKRAARGDLAYNMMRMWQGAVGIPPVDGLVSPAYVVARPYPEADSRYFEYLFRTGAYMNEVDKYSRGIVKDRNRLYWDDFKRMPSAVPHRPEQEAIADFLDHVDRRIRRYIRGKRRLIALLNEQKQAIIHRAVTRGLDPDVRLKPSGVEWLGEVPEHWQVRKVRMLSTRVTKGTTPTTLGRSFTDAGIRFVKVESISKTGAVIPDKCAFIDAQTDSLLSRSRLRAGDILVAIAGAIGRVAVVRGRDLPANTNQAVAIVSPIEKIILPDWLARFLSSPSCQRSLTDSSVQSAQANLSLADLSGTMIALPPLSEQRLVVKALAERAKAIERAIALNRRQVNLIQEYRTCLIADVVTGKLDVREAAARLPAEPDESEDADILEELDEPGGAEVG